MTGRVSRRWVMAGLLAGVAAPVLADAPARSLRPVPRPGSPAALAAPAVARVAAGPGGEALVTAAKLGGRVGFVVADARTGAVLEALAPDTALPPASTAKVMTALFALDKLGPQHRFATRLLATGPVSGGTIRGNLVLAGGGDPTLSTDVLAAMAAALRARGVTGVSGQFLYHDGALPVIDAIDPGQPDHVGYNPALSGLNLNFNRVYFEWKRGAGGWDVGMDARSDRLVPAVSMARMQVVQRESPLYTYAGNGGMDSWTVAAGALGKGGSRWLPVRHPGAYAADVFRTLARAQGVTLPAPAAVRNLPGGTVLVAQPSPALPEALEDMLKFSTNLTAEVMGLTASGAATLGASGRAMGSWATGRFGRSGKFVDHSGLGAASRVAPADMVAALVAARAGPLRALMKPFAPRDAEGRELKDSKIQVAAKTGTLNFVSGLTGYVTTPGGTDLAFAIFAADVPRRDAVPMAQREQPAGGQAWLKRARTLQGQLIGRWAAVHG